MTTTKIAPKYVNAAGAGKKYGSVVDQDGTKYLVKQEHMGSFHKGVEMDIETRSEPWTNGTLIASPAASAAPPSPAPSNGNGHSNGNGNGKDEHIYVCGIVNNWVSTLQGRAVTAQDLTLITNAARDAYRQTLGAK